MDSAGSRPLVTLYVVSYNHEKFIRQAIESALAQTYRPIQFIFSDDCSTDRGFEIMREMAGQHQGQEDILLNRNRSNMGTVDHLNRIFFEFARGKYLIPLAGDDVTSPDRTEKVVSLLQSTMASAVSVNPVLINENGYTDGRRLYKQYPAGLLHFESFFRNNLVFFGAGGYAREIFDIYGPMKNSARNEDTILALRASTLGGIAYMNEPVYLYRFHGNNMSYWSKISRDPGNRDQYVLAANRNELQNFRNFSQEVSASYRGPERDKLLALLNSNIGRLARLVAEGELIAQAKP